MLLGGKYEYEKKSVWGILIPLEVPLPFLSTTSPCPANINGQQWVSVDRVKKSQGEVMGSMRWETKHNPFLTNIWQMQRDQGSSSDEPTASTVNQLLAVPICWLQVLDPLAAPILPPLSATPHSSPWLK